jgi:thiol:disulfide interchange protein DsbA
MKNAFLISVALLLAACGAEDPAPTSTEAALEDTLDAGIAEETIVEPEPAEEAIEIVEESASEPEPEEQAIVLAQADTSAAINEWQFKENQHYYRLTPTQPTTGGADKIEVAEFFWYGCPHCKDFEPFINGWADTKPANVRFVRIPAMWNRGLALHAKLYYTEEVLVRNGVIKEPAAFRATVFQEYHQRRNRLNSEESIQILFARFNVSSEEFERTWNSFEVNQKLRVADDLARRYGISNVPVVVVNGKYRTGGAEAGSYPKLLEVIDELVARESLR